MKALTQAKHWLHIALLLVASLIGSQAIAAEYAVIINGANNYSASDIEHAKKDIRLFYLKEQSEWPNNEKVKPYGLLSTSAGQLAFNKEVLGMSEAELTRHWLNKKQTTGETPPKALKSDRIVVKLVAKKPGAFGVISTGSIKLLSADTKVLFEF